MSDRKIPLDAEPGETEDAGQTDDTGDAEATADEPVFENRAARRARGKGSAAPKPTSGKEQHVAGRGSVQGPRQWGNRRSG
ncbi:MAG TPA: hypothetical protein VF755_20610 [Catenuloplanes sp.]|jgi:hypothetical protein